MSISSTLKLSFTWTKLYMPRIFPLPCEWFWRSVQNLFPLAELLSPTGKGKERHAEIRLCVVHSGYQCVCIYTDMNFFSVAVTVTQELRRTC